MQPAMKMPFSKEEEIKGKVKQRGQIKTLTGPW